MKIRHFVFAAIAMIACAACQEKNITPDVPAQDQEVYTVQLGFGGEWDVTYEPLTRGNDNNDLYGIQVYSAPVEGNEAWSPYAYGLFDNIENLTVSLLKGFKYKFVSSMVVDGKTKIGNGTSFASPFTFYKYPSTYNQQLSNSFIYIGSQYMSYLGIGWTYLVSYSSYFKIAPVERYYGELIDYVPEESNNNKAKIHMKRTCFGAKFMAQGKLATAGQLEIKMEDAPVILLDLANEKQHDDIYTFYNVKDAHDYKTGNYEEDIDVSINWYYQHEDGSTVTVPLGTHKITYKRNATTVVKINLENTNVEGGIGFELTETGVMETVAEYEINDGNNVDTEIDTNK